MALSKAVKGEVIRLLQEGKLSKRAIHRQTGVSRVTIDKLEHTILFPQEKKKPPSPPKFTKTEIIECPKCGKRLIADTPCLTCSLSKQPLPEKDWFEQLLTPGG